MRQNRKHTAERLRRSYVVGTKLVNAIYPTYNGYAGSRVVSDSRAETLLARIGKLHQWRRENFSQRMLDRVFAEL